MDIINNYSMILLVMAGIFGLLMAAGIGMNDVANAMGTSVGSKALTIKQAILVAMVFEFAGAFLAGGQVTSTIRKGIIDPSALTSTPELLVFGMLAALLAAGIWLLIASMLGWPVSTTHSIVGAIVGFGAVGIGMDAVNWSKIGSIVASWVVSPLVAGTLSYMIFRSVQKLILNTDDPFDNAKKYVPFYMFLSGFIVSLVTFLKGLKHVGLNVNGFEATLYSLVVGLIIALIGKSVISKINFDKSANKDFYYASVEKVFAILMIVTACTMAFAHGSNDVANAIGPLAAIVSVVESGGEIAKKSALPIWILFVGAAGIVAGLAVYGHKVISTIGKGITELTPSRGFAAELAAASTVVIASGTGIPVSTTQILVGAVLGIGLARGIGALNLTVIRGIFMSWIITLPAGAGLAILFFFTFKGMFM